MTSDVLQRYVDAKLSEYYDSIESVIGDLVMKGYCLDEIECVYQPSATGYGGRMVVRVKSHDVKGSV